MKSFILKEISPLLTFEKLVRDLHNLCFEEHDAPGLMVGLSGTDSIVAFIMCYRALELENKGHRLTGVHFAPSEDYLYDHPEAEVHTWFEKNVIPWLQSQCPKATINVDSSIDWRCDGLRWGRLLDLSVVHEAANRKLRAPEEQFWVVGTKNATEDALRMYSNASQMVSIQPLSSLYKSYVLDIAKALNCPQIALDKSRETDCICGRDSFYSDNIKDIDTYLTNRDDWFLDEPKSTGDAKFDIIAKEVWKREKAGSFKIELPYSIFSHDQIVYKSLLKDPILREFQEGTLKLSEFDHRQHVYVAWQYAQHYENNALAMYAKDLEKLLKNNHKEDKFNYELTKKYFRTIDSIKMLHPDDSFEEFWERFKNI